MLYLLRKKMKAIMVTVAVLFAATMFYGLGYQGLKSSQEINRKGSIATINGKEIDRIRFQQTMNRLFSGDKERLTVEKAIMYQIMALEQTIDFTLLLAEAKKHNRISGRELEQVIEQIVVQNKIPNKDALKKAVENTGQSYSDFKRTLRDELLVSKLLTNTRNAVSITPDDLREVRASHILIAPRGFDDKADSDVRMKAENLLQKIKKGESFSALAKANSDDISSSKKGGDLGYFTTGMMVPEFEKIAFSLKPGEVSNVFRTKFGYHIVKVESTRLRMIAEKGKDINEVVLAEKQDLAMKKLSSDLRAKAKIEIDDPMLKAHHMMLKGAYREAIDLYNQAGIRKPYDPYVHIYIGNAYVKAGSRDMARPEFDRAAQLAGADPSVLITIGDAYRDIKDIDKALEQYRRASLISGDNEYIHKMLLEIFKTVGSTADMEKERSELNRIEKKKKFESEIQKKMGQ